MHGHTNELQVRGSSTRIFCCSSSTRCLSVAHERKILKPIWLQHDTHEALGGVVHVSDLEAVLICERLGERLAQRCGRETRLVAVLELREDHLQPQNTGQVENGAIVVLLSRSFVQPEKHFRWRSTHLNTKPNLLLQWNKLVWRAKLLKDRHMFVDILQFKTELTPFCLLLKFMVFHCDTSLETQVQPPSLCHRTTPRNCSNSHFVLLLALCFDLSDDYTDPACDCSRNGCSLLYRTISRISSCSHQHELYTSSSLQND